MMEGKTLTVQMVLTPIETGQTHTWYEKHFKEWTLLLAKPTGKAPVRLYEGHYHSVKDGVPLFRVASQKKPVPYTHYVPSHLANIVAS